MPSLSEKIERRLAPYEEALRCIVKRRTLSIRQSTKRSLHQEALRIAFITFCILVDGLLPFEFVVRERNMFGVTLTAASLLLLLLSQLFAYLRFWGKKPLLKDWRKT